MKIHEYQAKEVIAKYGATVPQSFVAKTVDDALEAAKKLPGDVCVVKAQIHAGGRGKGGGVKVSKGMDEVKENATNILGMQLVTKQTGPEGQKVKTLLVCGLKRNYTSLFYRTERPNRSAWLHQPKAA